MLLLFVSFCVFAVVVVFVVSFVFIVHSNVAEVVNSIFIHYLIVTCQFDNYLAREYLNKNTWKFIVECFW